MTHEYHKGLNFHSQLELDIRSALGKLWRFDRGLTGQFPFGSSVNKRSSQLIWDMLFLVEKQKRNNKIIRLIHRLWRFFACCCGGCPIINQGEATARMNMWWIFKRRNKYIDDQDNASLSLRQHWAYANTHEWEQICSVIAYRIS